VSVLESIWQHVAALLLGMRFFAGLAKAPAPPFADATNPLERVLLQAPPKLMACRASASGAGITGGDGHGQRRHLASARVADCLERAAATGWLIGGQHFIPLSEVLYCWGCLPDAAGLCRFLGKIASPAATPAA
jgi:hypothetical protein